MIPFRPQTWNKESGDAGDRTFVLWFISWDVNLITLWHPHLPCVGYGLVYATHTYSGYVRFSFWACACVGRPGLTRGQKVYTRTPLFPPIICFLCSLVFPSFIHISTNFDVEGVCVSTFQARSFVLLFFCGFCAFFVYFFLDYNRGRVRFLLKTITDWSYVYIVRTYGLRMVSLDRSICWVSAATARLLRVRHSNVASPRGHLCGISIYRERRARNVFLYIPEDSKLRFTRNKKKKTLRSCSKLRFKRKKKHSGADKLGS